MGTARQHWKYLQWCERYRPSADRGAGTSWPRRPRGPGHWIESRPVLMSASAHCNGKRTVPGPASRAADRDRSRHERSRGPQRIKGLQMPRWIGGWMSPLPIARVSSEIARPRGISAASQAVSISRRTPSPPGWRFRCVRRAHSCPDRVIVHPRPKSEITSKVQPWRAQ